MTAGAGVCYSEEEHTTVSWEEPVALLGMTIEEVFEHFGPPQETFAHRGEQESEDTVVFYYEEACYLFWYKNRVWQVRYDKRFSGTALGLAMGVPRGEVEAVLGEPLEAGSESCIYRIGGRPYPVIAHCYFTDEGLSDLYVYRGDF
jgi:hypothetical protein